MRILLATHDHLGDSVILTAGLHDAKKEFPDIEFDYEGNYGAVFENNPDITHFSRAEKFHRVFIGYNGGERTGEKGNMCEGMANTLAVELEKLTEKYFEICSSAPCLYLTDEEKTRDFGIRKPYCIINSNSQDRSEVKAYPHYQQIIDILREKGVTSVLIGGDAKRDITEELTGCVDLRMKTSIRDLFSLVWQCDGVISPASGVIHIAAAFGRKSLCITGAREPMKLTDYPNCMHATSECGQYNSGIGCMKFHLYRDRHGCQHIMCKNGKLYPKCMGDVPPSVVCDLYPEDRYEEP